MCALLGDPFQSMYGKAQGFSYLLGPHLICEVLPHVNRRYIEDLLVNFPYDYNTSVENEL